MAELNGPTSSSRVIAIGDIHGCARALDTLIETIQPTADDLIIPVGDYVDRGPDSRGVIDRLVALSLRCRLIPLFGNHEIMMLAAIENGQMQFWLDCGGSKTVASYGGDVKNVPAEHLAFIRGCHRYYETASHLFVHANYQYNLPLDEQPDELLFWSHISYQPPRPHQSGKIAIVGHTPQPEGEVLDLGYVIAIDTYCFGTGWLTALNVETGEIWQADKHGRLRPS